MGHTIGQLSTTHTLSFIFSSLSSIHFYLYTLCGRPSCFFTPFPLSLGVGCVGRSAARSLDGDAPSDDRVVFSSTHSLTHFDYVPYPFIYIHIHFVDISHACKKTLLQTNKPFLYIVTSTKYKACFDVLHQEHDICASHIQTESVGGDETNQCHLLCPFAFIYSA